MNAIDVKETAETRTIWHREFELAHCTRCGAVIGTKAQVEYALAQSAESLEEAYLCDGCRKGDVAEALKKAYRFV